jgi:Trk-type K+ transport system membrane component
MFLMMFGQIHTPEVTRIPVGIRFVDGLFQAASTRTAGLAVVDLSKLHAAVQVSYMIMMYISVYPIAISLRRTNVYEERSLGIYSYPDEEEEDAKEPSYVGTHLRKQLSFDLWYIFLGLFLLAIIEGSRLGDRGDYDFGMFAVLFEIVSAYGTVGLSLGYPDTTTSFCAQFKTLSKLIIIAMEIRGRHRGLPYELDRAILLPSESLHKKEAADAARRIRSRSIAMGPAASFPRSENTFPQFAGVGVSTGRQQREDTPVLSPRSQEVGLTEIPPMRRLSFANNVTKMPTHQEDH